MPVVGSLSRMVGGSAPALGERWDEENDAYKSADHRRRMNALSMNAEAERTARRSANRAQTERQVNALQEFFNRPTPQPANEPQAYSGQRGYIRDLRNFGPARPEELVTLPEGPGAGMPMGGTGGPQVPPDGEPDELAAIEAELARREELQAIEAELAKREGGPQQEQAPPGMQWVDDPLAKGGRGLQPVQEGDTRPWNQKLGDAISLPEGAIRDRIDPTGGKDAVRQVAGGFVEGALNFPGMALKDPAEALKMLNPAHWGGSMLQSGGETVQAIGQGDFEQAAIKGVETLGNAANTAASFIPGGPAARAGQAPVGKAAIREAGDTLATVVGNGQPIRPQALEAVGRILVSSNIPTDRINLGLRRIVDVLQEPTSRPATVAQLLEREFGEQFPQVVENIRTVVRERGLTRDRKDASPTIVRETTQNMRETQVPFLQDSARRNLGGEALADVRDNAVEAMAKTVEEGYRPALSQPISPEGTAALQAVLNDPATARYLKALEQDALENGTTVEAMIAADPASAAHWVQSKARQVAETDADLRRTASMRRDKILAVLEKYVPGYREARLQYGDEFGSSKAVNLGDSFLSVANNEFKLTDFIRDLDALSETQRPAGLASIRNAIETVLRGAPQEAPARLARISSQGVLDALERLGDGGVRLADDIRALRSENEFLGATTNRGQSATVPNALAMQQGPDLYSRGSASSPAINALADAGMMTAGLTSVPLLTLMREGPKLYKGLMQPRRQTREDMTRVLMARQQERPNALAPDGAPQGPRPLPGSDEAFSAYGRARVAALEAGDPEALIQAYSDMWPRGGRDAAQRRMVKEFVDARKVGPLIDSLPQAKAVPIREAIRAGDTEAAVRLINDAFPRLGKQEAREVIDAFDDIPLPKGVHFTANQALVWQSMERGESNRQIAKKLGLEYDTQDEIVETNKYIDIILRSVSKKMDAAGHTMSDPKAMQMRQMFGDKADLLTPRDPNKKPPSNR